MRTEERQTAITALTSFSAANEQGAHLRRDWVKGLYVYNKDAEVGLGLRYKRLDTGQAFALARKVLQEGNLGSPRDQAAVLRTALNISEQRVHELQAKESSCHTKFAKWWFSLFSANKLQQATTVVRSLREQLATTALEMQKHIGEDVNSAKDLALSVAYKMAAGQAKEAVAQEAMGLVQGMIEKGRPDLAVHFLYSLPQEHAALFREPVFALVKTHLHDTNHAHTALRAMVDHGDHGPARETYEAITRSLLSNDHEKAFNWWQQTSDTRDAITQQLGPSDALRDDWRAAAGSIVKQACDNMALGKAGKNLLGRNRFQTACRYYLQLGDIKGLQSAVTQFLDACAQAPSSTAMSALKQFKDLPQELRDALKAKGVGPTSDWLVAKGSELVDSAKAGDFEPVNLLRDAIQLYDAAGRGYHRKAKFAQAGIDAALHVSALQKAVDAAGYSVAMSVTPKKPVEGSNAIDRAGAEEWIGMHDTTECQAALRSVVDETRYVGFTEFERSVGETMQDFNRRLAQLPPHEQDYVMLVRTGKSNKWVGDLALQHLDKLPTAVLDIFDLPQYLKQNPHVKRILLPDDAVFSGQQMEQGIGIHARHFREANITGFQIYVGAAYMTSFGERIVDNALSGLADSESRVHVLQHETMPSIEETVPNSHHSTLRNMFCSGHATLGNRSLIIFGHKVADERSTLTSVYEGQVRTPDGKPATERDGIHVKKRVFVNHQKTPYSREVVAHE